MLVLSVPAPTSRANLTGLVNRTRLIRRSPLVLEIVRGGIAASRGGHQSEALVVLVGKLVENLGGLQSKLIRFRSLG